MEKELTIEQVNTPKKLGVAIKRLRKSKGLTQTELAEKINVRQATISDFENGRGGTIETLLKIIQALKVNFALSNQSKLKKTNSKSSVMDLL